MLSRFVPSSKGRGLLTDVKVRANTHHVWLLSKSALVQKVQVCRHLGRIGIGPSRPRDYNELR